MDKIIIHKDRILLEISGADRKNFLQGLITNDINKIAAQGLIYAAMLNSQGRFLYDFFIFEKDEKIFLDCFAPRADEILKKLNFYKLRSQVAIVKNDEMVSCQIMQASVTLGFSDPRHKNLGQRIYLKKTELENFIKENNLEKTSADFYSFMRISNKIPESEHDLTYEKSFILEFGFNDLNAIDYNKGCYIGQELTARTHHLGQIRKKIIYIKIPNSTQIAKNIEITCEGNKVGIVLSSVFFNNELHALLLVRI